MASYSSEDVATPSGQGNASAQALSSVVRKKLMGYVGFANLPNQVHRKSVKKGFQFTTMVVGQWFCSRPWCSGLRTNALRRPAGESGLGKSTLVNTLFNTTLYQPKVPLAPSAERAKTVAIESITAGTSFRAPL